MLIVNSVLRTHSCSGALSCAGNQTGPTMCLALSPQLVKGVRVSPVLNVIS